MRRCAALRRQAHRASRRVGPTPGNAGKPGGGAPGDGWAARRDPETNIRVFYDAGLYLAGWPVRASKATSVVE